MDDFVFHRNSLRWWDWSMVRWLWLNLLPSWRKTSDCRALETVLVRYCETKQHKYSEMQKNTPSIVTYLFSQPVNPHCRFIYWWSNAGISTLSSVHHSVPWLSLWRTSGEPTNSNRLCSLLSSTTADLLFLSLSVLFSQPVTTALQYEPDHTWLIGPSF